jgi:hypothetical protein
MLMKTAILIGVLSVTAGCYNYNPLTTPASELGTYLAVTLNDAGSDALARSLGPGMFVVRGRYLGPGDRGLLVSVSSVETKRGIGYPWQGETVTLPTDAIASLDVRQLSKGRSLLLASLGAGGVVATTLAFSLLGGGTSPNSCPRQPCIPGKK